MDFIKGIGIAFVMGCLGCASPPPILEYTLARTAVEAAREKESAKYAAGFWHRADEYYRKGEEAYKQSEYGDASKYFQKARVFAERAENSTRLKLFETGEGAP